MWTKALHTLASWLTKGTTKCRTASDMGGAYYKCFNRCVVSDYISATNKGTSSSVIIIKNVFPLNGSRGLRYLSTYKC